MTAEQYPLSDYASAGLAWATLLTDRVWARATFRQNQLLSAHNSTFAYEFADRNAPGDVEFPPSLPHGAAHSSDISYLFPDDEFTGKLSSPQRALSDQMIDYWANFARQGDPNGEGLPKWPLFAEGDHVQSPAPDSIKGVDYATEHRLGFWAAL